MASEKTYVKGDRSRVVATPRDEVRLRADGWRELVPAPPRNASTDTWREFAEQEHVEVPDGAGRADIIAAVEDATTD